MSERRHRISHNELPPVTEAIENQLREWLQFRRSEHIHSAEQLFRLWYRIMIHREGRPDYPEPITWGVIDEYLGGTGEMVPFMLEAAR